MKNADLYHKTVDILAKAYVNNQLHARNSCCCAVGNIIAANMGYRDNTWYPLWTAVFCTADSHKILGFEFVFQTTHPKIYETHPGARREIDSTGYTWQELAKIEKAFEANHRGKDPMFNSLMACIKVLDKIHQVKDKEVKTQTRVKFPRKAVTV